jgi:hypothetical protein
MPIIFDIDTDRGAVIATSWGTLTEAEIQAAAKEAFQDSRFHPAHRAFFDHSKVTSWKVSTEFMTGMASARQRSDSARTAVLIHGPLAHGLVRAYQAFVNYGQVKIFTDRSGAVTWLNEGVPPEKHIT